MPSRKRRRTALAGPQLATVRSSRSAVGYDFFGIPFGFPFRIAMTHNRDLTVNASDLDAVCIEVRVAQDHLSELAKLLEPMSDLSRVTVDNIRKANRLVFLAKLALFQARDVANVSVERASLMLNFGTTNPL